MNRPHPYYEIRQWNLVQALDLLPDAAFIIDTKGIVVAWNIAMEEMSGVKRRNMLGKGNYEYALPFYGQRVPMLIDLLMHPEYIKKYRGRYKYFKKQGEVISAVTPYAKFGDRFRCFWGKVSLGRDEKGGLQGGIQIMRDVTEQKKTVDELKSSKNKLLSQRKELESKNAALHEVMEHISVEKTALKKQICANMDAFVFPLLARLRKTAPVETQKSIDVLEAQLRNLCSVFGLIAMHADVSLSARERQIALYIKEGMHSKEIASLLNISLRSVETHRYHLRRKLKLSEHDNLEGWLQTQQNNVPLDSSQTLRTPLYVVSK